MDYEDEEEVPYKQLAPETVLAMKIRRDQLKLFVQGAEHRGFKDSIRVLISDNTQYDLEAPLLEQKDILALCQLRGARAALQTVLTTFEDALANLEADIDRDAIAEVKAQEAINQVT